MREGEKERERGGEKQRERKTEGGKRERERKRQRERERERECAYKFLPLLNRCELVVFNYFECFQTTEIKQWFCYFVL